MKILSVFSNGNEIAIRNTIWGTEKIFYNHKEVSSKYSFFGAVHHFEVQEDRNWVTYVIKVGFNNLGVSANVWRDGQPLAKGLCASYESCRPRQESSRSTSHGSTYHQDLV